MKSIGIKFEGSRRNYARFYFRDSAKWELNKLVNELKYGQTLEVKVGNNHYYIEYDYDQSHLSRVDDVMYHINKYLAS